MTLNEVIDRIEADGGYTDDNVAALEQALFDAEPKDFYDPTVRTFIKFINTKDYDPRIQKIVEHLVKYMNDKGIDVPCASSCDESCEFHEEEFGNG